MAGRPNRRLNHPPDCDCIWCLADRARSGGARLSAEGSGRERSYRVDDSDFAPPPDPPNDDDGGKGCGWWLVAALGFGLLLLMGPNLLVALVVGLTDLWDSIDFNSQPPPATPIPWAAWKAAPTPTATVQFRFEDVEVSYGDLGDDGAVVSISVLVRNTGRSDFRDR